VDVKGAQQRSGENGGVILLVSRAGGLLRRPPVKRALDRLTGWVLVAFGVRLATERP
jgi:threonine/homoserine/homoserine lactone efflux protein